MYIQQDPEQLQVGDAVWIGETPENVRYAVVAEKVVLSSDGTLRGITVCYAGGESYQLFLVDAPVFWRLLQAPVREEKATDKNASESEV